jgi:hypothetical protein
MSFFPGATLEYRNAQLLTIALRERDEFLVSRSGAVRRAKRHSPEKSVRHETAFQLPCR